MDEEAKKRTLRAIPYGLYVVGVRGPEVRDPAADLNAFIGSWVAQTSFKPPMVVVGVKRGSRSHDMIKETGALTLSLLRADQKDTAVAFFKDLDIRDGRMNGVPFDVSKVNGCPFLPDALGSLDCEVVHAYEGENDHTVFVAKVLEARGDGAAEPLTHANTGWHYGG